MMNEEEKDKFGERCPLGFEKFDLFTKTESTITWLGMK
jgi:hypothetical protein